MLNRTTGIVYRPDCVREGPTPELTVHVYVSSIFSAVTRFPETVRRQTLNGEVCGAHTMRLVVRKWFPSCRNVPAEIFAAAPTSPKSLFFFIGFAAFARISVFRHRCAQRCAHTRATSTLKCIPRHICWLFLRRQRRLRRHK